MCSANTLELYSRRSRRSTGAHFIPAWVPFAAIPIPTLVHLRWSVQPFSICRLNFNSLGVSLSLPYWLHYTALGSEKPGVVKKQAAVPYRTTSEGFFLEVPNWSTMATRELMQRSGQIWSKRPRVCNDGLLVEIKNHSHRQTNTIRPKFEGCAFNLTGNPCAMPCHLLSFHSLWYNATAGEVCATVDKKGHVVCFYFSKNQYEHLTHCGVPGVDIVFSPIRKTELFVSLSNGEVSGTLCSRSRMGLPHHLSRFIAMILSRSASLQC